ncbi:hypothetical protein J4734_24110 [Klebsiella pneumoniae]|uniref:Uncharacterized protein n=1 Tax=Klebsiella pneumoniae TaxID=573 RepID=A0A939SVR0_KLEPN|nr:hypothetical protein [Klebsiella pneumoniae]
MLNTQGKDYLNHGDQMKYSSIASCDVTHPTPGRANYIEISTNWLTMIGMPALFLQFTAAVGTPARKFNQLFSLRFGDFRFGFSVLVCISVFTALLL